MATVNVHDAKTHFSRLLRRVAAGEEIIIARGGTPVARLIPYAEDGHVRTFGQYAGSIGWSDDFDAALPDDMLDEFDGTPR
jgi:prevent-host-death family protein